MVALRRERNERLNLLIVGTDYPPQTGGISTYTAQVAAALSERWNVSVLAPGAAGAAPWDETRPYTVFRTPNVPVLRLVAFGIYFPWLMLRLRTDAVLHAVWTTSLLSHLWRAVLRKPYFVVVYASEILDDTRSLRRRIKGYLGPWRRAALGQASCVFPISRYTGRVVESLGINKSRIRVITLGVDPVRYSPPTAPAVHTGEQRLLTVARLDLHKGHDMVLEALSLLKRDGLRPSYTIAGDGDEGLRLRTMVETLKLSDQIRFAGFVEDECLPRLYAESDIFIMASREIPGRVDLIEGFGLAFIEASASGLPVIAGRSGGVPDAVRDGETGLLVDPGDPAAIAEAIRLLTTNVQLARRLGRQGRRWVEEEMNWERVGRRLGEAMAQRMCAGTTR